MVKAKLAFGRGWRDEQHENHVLTFEKEITLPFLPREGLALKLDSDSPEGEWWSTVDNVVWDVDKATAYIWLVRDDDGKPDDDQLKLWSSSGWTRFEA